MITIPISSSHYKKTINAIKDISVLAKECRAKCASLKKYITPIKRDMIKIQCSVQKHEHWFDRAIENKSNISAETFEEIILKTDSVLEKLQS